MSSALDPSEFRQACGQWATGVSIVTTADDTGRPFGLTMNAVTSLSLDPPMLLVCVDGKSDTLGPMTQSRSFCVNVLSQAQQELSNRFAKKGENKFEGVDYSSGGNGSPVLAGSLITFECAVREIFPGGDHQIFCGEVVAMHPAASEDVEPLLYFGGGYGRLAT